MQNKSTSRLASIQKVLNSLTVLFFVLSLLSTFLSIFSDGYNFGDLSYILLTWSNARTSGLLDINGEAIGTSALLCFVPLSLWIAGVLALFFFLSRRRSGPASSKKTIMFSSIMLAASLILFTSLLFIGSSLSCVPDTLTGSSPTCQIPVSPHAPVLTPGP